MKKYIREILNDLQPDRSSKDFLPPVPPAPEGGKTTYLDPPPQPVIPGDLENQDLSADPEEAVRQLDFQSQQDEVRETLEP
jgi:hypothetical protein